MTKADIDRYCSVEGVECTRSVDYRGDWSFFFAYPSAAHWRDFSRQLVDELSSRGIYGQRWEDVVQGNLIFSKVCDGIHSHDLLLAEVTEPNPNVLFEVGYALAVGRQPVLLVDKNRQAWDRRLLRAVESCLYETREDIHQFVSKLVGGERTVSSNPNRRLPLLENTGIFEQASLPGTVYHLRPKTSTDWIHSVDSVLRSSFFKLTSMDPTDATYDEFFPQARKIQESELIVASFLSKSNTDATVLNANVGLLTGFAVGLGKQVMALVQKPSIPILDLGTLLREFETETEAKRIAGFWLEHRTKQAVERTQTMERSAARRREADKVRGAFLGHPDAAQDNNLLDYYVPTKEFNDAVEGHRNLFLGRRGSGKSATFAAVVNELEQRASTVVVPIAPDNFELERLTGFFGSDYANVNPKLLYSSVWHYVLLSEILKTLERSTPILYTSPDDVTRNWLVTHYREHEQDFSVDFATRLIVQLQQISDSPADAASEERRNQLDGLVKKLRDYGLGRHLLKFAKEQGMLFHVVIDDLDKHWRPDSIQSIELLIGLLDEINRLCKYSEGKLKMSVFLRQDIFEVLQQYDEDLVKRNFLKMEWTHLNLRRLVAERIAHTVRIQNQDDEQTWGALFEPLTNGQTTSEYVLSRVLPRPRDVLDFCQKAVDQAQRNGHDIIRGSDVLDAEVQFSENVFISVKLEFQALYPRLDETMIEFAGAPEVMTWNDFVARVNVAIGKYRKTMSSWYGAEKLDAEFIATVLFRIGMIGFAKKGTQLSLFANGKSYSESLSLVKPSPQVLIHPAFARFLELTPVASQARDHPTRSRTSELQMPLDIDEQ